MSEPMHEQQLLHIELGAIDGGNDFENRITAADAFCQERSIRTRSYHSDEPGLSVQEH